jgi:hypothetical protein
MKNILVSSTLRKAALLPVLFGMIIADETTIAQTVAPDVTLVGRITHFAISESSGLVASRRYPGVMWTHNDGGLPFLFAIREDGRWVRGIQVIGAKLIDWEDIAIDNTGNLYLADIGIDGLARTHVAVHRVVEPNPSRNSNAYITRTWLLRFPNFRQDAEAFFVWNGFGYLVTKVRINGAVSIYRYPLSAGSGSTTLQKIADVSVTAQVTAADISMTGERLALLTEEGAYSIIINGVVSQAAFGPRSFTPFISTFMEGAAFVGRGLLVSSETRNMLLFTHKAFQVR